MEIIDYRKPLELNCILIDKMPMANNTVGMGVLPFRARITWESIVSVEDFVRVWLLPPDSEVYNLPKVNIITEKMVYTVTGNYEDVVEAWDSYKIWASNKSIFNCN